MADDDQGGAAVGTQSQQQLDDALAIGGIEAGSGFIGQQQGRFVDERASNRHALLLAERQLSGALVDARGEADALQQLRRSPASLRPRPLAAVARPEQDVVQGRQGAGQIKRLEDQPDMQPAEHVGLRDAELVHRHAVDRDRSTIRSHEPGEQVQECGLAAAARAGHQDALTRSDAEPIYRATAATGVQGYGSAYIPPRTQP